MHELLSADRERLALQLRQKADAAAAESHELARRSADEEQRSAKRVEQRLAKGGAAIGVPALGLSGIQAYFAMSLGLGMAKALAFVIGTGVLAVVSYLAADRLVKRTGGNDGGPKALPPAEKD